MAGALAGILRYKSPGRAARVKRLRTCLHFSLVRSQPYMYPALIPTCTPYGIFSLDRPTTSPPLQEAQQKIRLIPLAPSQSNPLHTIASGRFVPIYKYPKAACHALIPTYLPKGSPEQTYTVPG